MGIISPNYNNTVNFSGFWSLFRYSILRIGKFLLNAFLNLEIKKYRKRRIMFNNAV